MYVKVCGLTEAHVASDLVRLGVHYIGLIFHPSSPRYVDLMQADQISRAVKTAGGTPVAVVVDMTASDIYALCERLSIDTVQCHGRLSRCEQRLLPATIKRLFVVPIDANGEMALSSPEQEAMGTLNPERDSLLYDSIQPGRGQAFPWAKIQPSTVFPYFIAGGLTANNIQAACQQLHPTGVDLNSGVETQPGKKSVALVKAVLDQLKQLGEFCDKR